MKPIVKYLFACLLSCAATFVLQAQSGQSGWKSDGLKGNVKEIREYSAIDNSGKLKKATLKSVSKYSDKGVKTEFDKYDSNGTLSSKTLYIYSENGSLTEEKVYRAIRKTWSRRVYKYDKSGRKTEKTSYASNGQIIMNEIYRYNKNGMLAESITEPRPDGRYFEKTAYRQDSLGRGIEMSIYKSGDSLANRHTLQRNAYGDITSKCIYSAEPKPHTFCMKFSYRYDSESKVLCKSIYDEEDELMAKAYFKYDSKGNQTEYAEYFEHTGKLAEGIIYEYEYFK